jgi:acyl-CoA oxidase
MMYGPEGAQDMKNLDKLKEIKHDLNMFNKGRADLIKHSV